MWLKSHYDPPKVMAIDTNLSHKIRTLSLLYVPRHLKSSDLHVVFIHKWISQICILHLKMASKSLLSPPQLRLWVYIVLAARK